MLTKTTKWRYPLYIPSFFCSVGSRIVATLLSKRYAHRREVELTPVLNRYRSRTARCNGKENSGERRFFPALPTSAIMIHNTIQGSYIYFLTSSLAFACRTIMMFHSNVHVHGTNEQYARALRFLPQLGEKNNL